MNGNLNQLEDILKLQEEIKQKQLDIAQKKKSQEYYNAQTNTLAGYRSDDLNPVLSQDFSELHELSSELEALSNERIQKQMEVLDFREEDLPESEQIEDPQLQSYNELIQPYRDKYPKKGDAYIEQVIRFENKPLYDTLTGGDKKKVETDDIPGVVQWGTGFASNTVKASYQQGVVTQLGYNIPATFATKMDLKLLDWGKGRLSRAVKYGLSLGAIPFKDEARKNKIREEILQNPNNRMSHSEINKYLDEAQANNKLEEALAVEWYAQGRQRFKQLVDNDTELRSYLNYVGDEGNRYFEGKIGKLGFKLLMDMLPSVLETRSAGALMGVIATKINPYSAGLSTVLQMGGQFAVGGALESSATTADALEFLINDEEITPEKFSRALSEKRKQFQKEVKDTNPKYDDTQVYNLSEQILKEWVDFGYENRNGKMFRKAYDPIEAVELVHLTTVANFVTSGIIEMSDVIASRVPLPFSGRNLKTALYGKTLTKLDDAFRASRAVAKVKALKGRVSKALTLEAGEKWGKTYAVRFFNTATGAGAKAWSEGFEEVSQANSEHMYRAYGPFGMEELKYDKGSNYVDEWDIHERVILPFLGGIAAGKGINSMTNFYDGFMEGTNLYDRVNKRSITKKMNSATGGVNVIKTGLREYSLEMNTSGIDSEGNLKFSKEEIKGEENKYARFKDAKEAANALNITNKDVHDKNMAKQNLYLAGAEVKRRKDGDNWIVEIIGEKGNVIKDIGKYDDINTAKKRVSDIQYNINSINRAVEKTGYSKLEKLLNEENKKADEEIGATEKVSEVNGIEYVDEKKRIVRRSIARMLVKGYMLGAKKKGTEDVVELTIEEEREWERIRELGLHKDDAFIAANALEYSDIFNEELIDIEEFKRDFKDQFGDSKYIESLEEMTKDDDYEDDIKAAEDVLEEYEHLVDDDDLEDRDIPITENDKKDIVSVEGIVSDLDFDTKEKKAPEVKVSRVVSKGSVQGVQAAENLGEGISVLRNFREPNKHYGNPFSALAKSAATVKVATVQESIERYDAWLRGKADQDVEPERRKWILEQIDKGILDNVDLLYHKDTPDNHAKRLEAFVNERKKKAPEVKKIISGGQVGADLLGLEVGKELGLETGGTAPPGFITTKGKQPDLLKGYGLIEGETDPKIYRKRTIKNVQDSDGTVIFADKPSSPGTNLTISAAKKNNKPYILNPTASELKEWMSKYNIETLNVAGNRAMKPEQVKPILKEALGKPEKKAPEVKVSETVTEKMARITSEFKGTKLLIKYDKYAKPFTVTMKRMDFISSSTVGGIKTNEYPSAHGITSTGKEVSFHSSEIVKGPSELIEKLEKIYSLKEVEGVKGVPAVVEEEVLEPEVTRISRKASILMNRTDSKTFKYTEGQARALIMIATFLNKRLPKIFKESVFVMAGYAGTGKTTIVENIINEAYDIGYKVIVYGALTNRATSVLRNKLTMIKDKATDYTIASLLFGKPNKKTGIFRPKPQPVTGHPRGHLFIFDEASLIGGKEFKAITEMIIQEGGKIIFIGDSFQLYPVEGNPFIFKRDELDGKPSVLLTEVMRQALKSPVLALATAMRMIGEGNDKIILPNESSKPSKYGQVHVLNESNLKAKFIDSWKDGDGLTVIVYSNKSKREMNSMARNSRYSKQKKYIEAKPGQPRFRMNKVYNDEVVQVISNTEINPSIKLSNGDILIGLEDFDIISDVTEVPNVKFKHKEDIGDKAKLIEITTGPKDYGGKIEVVPHPVYFRISTRKMYDKFSDEQKITARELGLHKHDGWVLLFPESPGSAIMATEDVIDVETLPNELLEDVIDVTGNKILKPNVVTLTYGYAITAHKAQGSQWENLSILSPSNWLIQHVQKLSREDKLSELNRWFYTAITRAEKDIYISQGESAKNLQIASWDEINEIAEKSSSKTSYQLKGKDRITSPSNRAKVRKFTRMMFDKFEGKIAYEFVNDLNLTDKFGNLVGAFYGPITKKMADKYGIKESKVPVVLINLALAEPDAPFHEYLHPFISDIRKNNPALYENLLKEILDTKSGKKELNRILELYIEVSDMDASGIINELGKILDTVDGNIEDLSGKELYELLDKFDVSDKTISDELIAFIAGRAAVSNVPKESKWRKILDKIIDWARSVLFGANWSVNVYARALDENTTVNDIARLLANSNRKFTLERFDSKLVKENFSFKPINRFKFWLFSKKKVENKVEEITDGNIFDDIKVKQATVNRMFKEIWLLSKMDGNKKMDKEDFAGMMIGDKENAILPEQLHGYFNEWYKSQFNVEAELGDNDYAVFDESIHDAIVEYMERNDEYISRNILGRLESNEKESTLASATLLYMKEFGYTLEESELKEIMKMARRLDFDPWVKFIYKDILRVTKRKLTPYRRRTLLKFYNQIQSTLFANRGEEAQNVINYEMLIDDIGNFTMVKKGKTKTYRAAKERIANAGYQKKTLFDFYAESQNNLFRWISGKDIKQEKINKFTDKSSINTLYGFLDEEQLQKFDSYITDVYGLAVAFSRGSSDKLALIDINNPELGAKEKLNNLAKYIAKEQADGLMSDVQAREFLKKIKGLSKTKQLAEIAVHEALKKVWPKYLIDGKNSANIYKRLKIPFTPVTVNEKMPDTRFFRFDPKEVLFQYKDDDPFSPMQKVKGKGKEYIGDGETITSSKEFKKYGEFHGLHPLAAIAKTVHYIKRGLDVFALKHQSFRAEPGLKILHKRTKKVLFTVSGGGNIFLGEGHPNYVKPKAKIITGRETLAGEENYVGMLGTADEIKIGTEANGIFKNSDELIIPGSAVGFIKYEEGMDKNARHPQQWYNHVLSEKIIKHFKEKYLPTVENRLRDAIRVALDTPNSPSHVKLAKLMNLLDKKGDDTRISSFRELIKLGAGKHRQTSIIADNFIYSSLLDDIMRLGFGVGSTYNIAMDVTGRLNPAEKGELGEVALYEKDPAVIKVIHAKYMKANDITDMENVTMEDINAWLAENKVNVMITRFPVPHQGGAVMSRVKFLHKREAVIMMEINDVKARLEGDNDGDHVEVEFLHEDIEDDYREHLSNLKVKPLNLPDFENPKNENNIEIDSLGRMSLIAKLTAGEWAIGELANIQGAYGSIVKLFDNIYANKIKVPLSTIRIKKMDEIIELPFFNKKGPWKGSIAEYLRLMLQAAVDNGKFGLLGEWGYSRESVIENLVEFHPSLTEAQKKTLLEKFVLPFFQLHSQPLHIRKGSTFEERFGFKKSIEVSNKYTSYATDRKGYLRQHLNLEVDLIKPNDINDRSPVEMIATAPSLIHGEMMNKLAKAGKPLLFRDGSPHIISNDLHGQAHRKAMELLDNAKETNLDKAASKDKKTGDLDFILSEIDKGEIYAEEMGVELEIFILNYGGEIGPQTADYNMEFMALKEKWHDIFGELSNVAKLSATYKFLEGEWSKEVSIKNKRTGEMEKQLIKGSPTGLHLPPVSDLGNQVSLLDAGLFQEYFKHFNKEVSDAVELIRSQTKYRVLYEIAKKDCQ